MIELIIAFLLGCLWTRTYYARIGGRTDWMRSSYWSKNRIYRKLHRLNCELCPKRWYCKRYEEQKKEKVMTTGLDPEIYEDQYKFFNEYGKTRVVNIKDDPSIINHPDFVYIGRYNQYYGLPESKWANPYQIGKDGSRNEVILKYVKNMPPELIACLDELKGKILGCWCKPLNCHGDSLVRILEGL